FRGKNVRQLLLQHTQDEPDLRALPERDRAVVAQALAKDAGKRYPTCMDFVRALRRDWSPASAERPIQDSKEIVRLPVTSRSVADTVSNWTAQADTWRGRRPAPLPAGMLRDYRLLECVDHGALMDQWKAKPPTGALRLVKVVSVAHDQGLHDLGDRLRALTHPALLPIEVVYAEPGRLVLLTDFIPTSLRERLKECQRTKLPGIPRAELLGYLRTCAEASDALYREHSVQHLGLNPRNLLVREHGELQIADFGLAQLFWLPARQAI